MKRVSTGSMKVLSDKKVCVGIDVHKESWHVTVRTDGEEVFNGRIPASYHSLTKMLERFEDCQLKVAYEAGPCGFFPLRQAHPKMAFQQIVVLLP